MFLRSFSNKKLKALRDEMVERQIIRRRITDSRIIEAMRRVPRHRFVFPQDQYKAYDDCPLSIGDGQTISQPYMVALMSSVLDLKDHESVLEIGTGSGYQTAILAEICRDVWTIERIKKLKLKAEKILMELNYTNVHFLTGEDVFDYEERLPIFNAIIITAAVSGRPDDYCKILGNGGRMVVPIGSRESQDLKLFTKTDSGIEEKTICRCVFVPLIGKYGWS